MPSYRRDSGVWMDQSFVAFEPTYHGYLIKRKSASELPKNTKISWDWANIKPIPIDSKYLLQEVKKFKKHSAKKNSSITNEYKSLKDNQRRHIDWIIQEMRYHEVHPFATWKLESLRKETQYLDMWGSKTILIKMEVILKRQMDDSAMQSMSESALTQSMQNQIGDLPRVPPSRQLEYNARMSIESLGSSQNGIYPEQLPEQVRRQHSQQRSQQPNLLPPPPLPFQRAPPVNPPSSHPLPHNSSSLPPPPPNAMTLPPPPPSLPLPPPPPPNNLPPPSPNNLPPPPPHNLPPPPPNNLPPPPNNLPPPPPNNPPPPPPPDNLPPPPPNNIPHPPPPSQIPMPPDSRTPPPPPSAPMPPGASRSPSNNPLARNGHHAEALSHQRLTLNTVGDYRSASGSDYDSYNGDEESRYLRDDARRHQSSRPSRKPRSPKEMMSELGRHASSIAISNEASRMNSELVMPPMGRYASIESEDKRRVYQHLNPPYQNIINVNVPGEQRNEKTRIKIRERKQVTPEVDSGSDVNSPFDSEGSIFSRGAESEFSSPPSSPGSEKSIPYIPKRRGEPRGEMRRPEPQRYSERGRSAAFDSSQRGSRKNTQPHAEYQERPRSRYSPDFWNEPDRKSSGMQGHEAKHQRINVASQSYRGTVNDYPYDLNCEKEMRIRRREKELLDSFSHKRVSKCCT